MHSAVTLFEIPTADFERGVRFYETVLDTTLRRESRGSTQVAMFPCRRDEGVSCEVCLREGRRPVDEAGTLVYLDAGDDLDAALDRVEPAGGEVVVRKTLIAPKIGYFAVLRDHDGNHVGLYSMQ